MEKRKMSLCVLMSTYNGENYIEEQIQSILKQECEADIYIQIRDDGSKDDTEKIVKKYQKKGNVFFEKGNNVGPAKSFMNLVGNSIESDYYAFSDQDDVWIQGKIQTAISEISLYDKNVPVLWISNYSTVDSELNTIEDNVLESPNLDELKSIFYNNIPGCVMVFNASLLKKLKKFGMNDMRMHDITALNIALITGKVIFNKNCFLYYRQHGGNVIGQYSKKIKINDWIIEKLRILYKRPLYYTDEYAQRILEIFYDEVENKKIKEYELIASYKKGLNRFRLLHKDYTKNLFDRNTISIRSRILLGIL